MHHKKKEAEITKMDKADRVTSELVEKVMKQQVEQRQKADELERENEIGGREAKRQPERDELFMTVLGLLLAMVRPPQP